MSREKPVVAITVGDYNGIGPEVALKSLRHRAVRVCCQPVLIGPAEVYRFYVRKLRLPLTFEQSDTATARSARSVRVIEPPREEKRLEISPGTLSSDAGRIAAEAISFAVQMIQQGEAHALVTAPVSKQALHLAQVDFPGQTEMLQRLSNSPSVAMMLVSPVMRVALATIHVPLRKVSEMLSRQLLRDRILTVYDALRTDWKIRSPRLAILGLNPHAGEGGDIGREDLDVIAPVVEEFRKHRMRIEGPLPADSFFGRYTSGRYDAVVAMYHDQGLIPLKMSSFGKAVNVSVGLPIVRTSPDHGTAFDIAGKGIADPGSMIEAIQLAARIAINRGLVRRKKR